MAREATYGEQPDYTIEAKKGDCVSATNGTLGKFKIPAICRGAWDLPESGRKPGWRAPARCEYVHSRRSFRP